MAFILGTFTLHSQVFEPVKWEFSINQLADNKIEVVADATIDDTWHLYSASLPEGGPIPTSLNLIDSDHYKVSGDLRQEPEPDLQYDQTFDMELSWFSNEARLILPVEVMSEDVSVIEGYVEFMACDDEQCLPPDRVDFRMNLDGTPVEASAKTDDDDGAMVDGESTEQEKAVSPEAQSNGQTTDSSDESGTDSYWTIFWMSLLAGFAALLTPCVFPMIPLTVSFFLRNADNKAKSLRDGLFYGLTIIFAYVVLGLAISLIFGANALNAMATSPIFNTIFFAILVFFAASFFGAFELTMPAKWSNSLDSKADTAGGLLGVVLMGLTFVLVSFSCTGPIVGTLLVEAAVGGSVYSPAIGMFGFGLALAIPFAVFAIFPTAMKSLPKSGGWMNSVKVVLGFIVLAFSLKFLSVADAVGEWEILDREVFLVLWIAIFMLMGLYLIGKIKFAHDSDLPYLSVPRLVLSIATFAFVFYLIPGLWGAPLRAVSSFLPSTVTQDFDLSRTQVSSRPVSDSGDDYSGDNVMEGPYGLMKYTDYEDGLAAAREAGKPVFLDFTGLGCANCRKMESQVWSDNTVRDLLANEFIIVSLYVDKREELPEDEQYISDVTGKRVRTVGNKWSDFQISRYERNSQPHYLILDHDENELIQDRGFNTNVDAYIEWLKKGLEAFEKEN